MLTTMNAEIVGFDAHELVSRGSDTPARALRRFLTKWTDDGEAVLLITHDASLTSRHLDAVCEGAEQAARALATAIADLPIDFVGVRRDDAQGLVALRYRLKHPIFLASRQELRDMTQAICTLVERRSELRLGYQYRGLPCNIAPREQLWHVSGTDVLNGMSGVLEWCHDETDARSCLQMMQCTPAQFDNLSVGRFLEAIAA